MCFFYLLAKTILLYPHMWNFEYKTEKLKFKALKKSCAVLNNPKFPKKMVYARKCNFKDFDTISVLQFYCSNTYRFGLPYYVAARRF